MLAAHQKSSAERYSPLTEWRTSRRGILRSAAKLAAGGALAAALAGRSGGLTLAQGSADAASPFATLGLTELKVTATDTGFEGLPAETAAGWHLVTLANSGKAAAAVNFLQLPDGMTFADFQQVLESARPPDGETATSAGGGEGEQQGGVPPWYYDVHIAGGTAAPPGQAVQAVLELRAGDYVVWGEDPAAPQVPVGLKVTPGGTAAVPQIAADVTVQTVHTADGFGFKRDGAFKAGAQVVKVVNPSAQPHFVEWDRVPAGTTLEQVMQSVMAPEGAAPVPGQLSEQDLVPVAMASTQSAGTTTYHAISLEAGTVLLSCWIGDPAKGGAPHAMEGMLDIVNIPG